MKAKKLDKKTLWEVLRELLEIDLHNCEVTVCLASLSEDKELPKLEKLQLSDELTEKFRGVVEAIQKKYRKDAERNDLELRAYDPGSKPDPHEVEFVDLAQHNSIKDQVDSLSALSSLPLFKVDDNFISGLRFYVIVVQCKNGEPIYWFRSYSQKKELSRSAIFAAILAEGHFDRIKTPVFLFDEHIDCISRGGVMLVFNKSNFQKIFRFFEMVMKAAEATLVQIKARVPIANFEEFKKACEGHLQMQAKLKNIAGKQYLNKITMADIKKVLKEFPQLGVQITKKNGREMLLFDPQDKWALLRLLDDDYLKSLMTGENYEVTGKRPYQK